MLLFTPIYYTYFILTSIFKWLPMFVIKKNKKKAITMALLLMLWLYPRTSIRSYLKIMLLRKLLSFPPLLKNGLLHLRAGLRSILTLLSVTFFQLKLQSTKTMKGKLYAWSLKSALPASLISVTP